MTADALKNEIDQIASRHSRVVGKGEEATKQAMVLPFLAALGFDIYNPEEVCLEFGADFAIKKYGQKEKVDVCLQIDGTPRMLVEVKAANCVLDGHCGQLCRYFNSSPTVPLGILTNGLDFWFYSDTHQPNIMDEKPFFTCRLDSPDIAIDVLLRFRKPVFSPEAIREYATELNYTARIVSLLRREIDLKDKEPSEELIRWILQLDQLYPGRVTANVVETFRPIVKNALRRVHVEIFRRMLGAMEREVSSSAQPPAAEITQDGDQDPEASLLIVATDDGDNPMQKIVTTENELDAFAVVKEIFESSPLKGTLLYDPQSRQMVPGELAYKDTTGYFGIYLNKPSWWVCRLSTESKVSWIGFPYAIEELIPTPRPDIETLAPHPYAKSRIRIREIADLRELQDIVLAALKRAQDEHRKQEVGS